MANIRAPHSLHGFVPTRRVKPVISHDDVHSASAFWTEIKGRLGLQCKFTAKATGRYPLQEKRLFDEITARRKNARKVSGWWISRRMRQLVREAVPNSTAKFGNNCTDLCGVGA